MIVYEPEVQHLIDVRNLPANEQLEGQTVMTSAFDPALHPITCEFLSKGSNGVYLEEIASRLPPGGRFPVILENNLSLTRDLFIDDQVFCNHLTSAQRDQVASRLSEIWLAAYLRRSGYDLERVPEGRQEGGQTPDFRIRNGGSYINVEVKRLYNTKDRYSVSALTVPAMAMRYNPLNDEFKRKLTYAIREVGHQLDYQAPSDKQSPGKMLAWDVGESLDFQMLCADESDTKIIAWLQDMLSSEQRKKVDYMLLYAMGIDNAEIYFPRLFTLLKT